MPDIIFHIGHGKTATTYLQKQIFPQVHALGNNSVTPGAVELEDKIRQAVLANPADIWKRDTGHDLARQIDGMNSRTPILYSSEWLLQPPIWASPCYIAPPQNAEFAIAEHLAAFARHAWGNKGNVYALVTIRDQAKWLASLYVQRSLFFEASQADFERRVRAFLKRDDYTGWRFLDYHLLYQDLCAALGPDKVTFLAYEDMHTPHYWQVLNNLLDAGFEMPQMTANDRANVRRKDANTWQLRQQEIQLHNKLPQYPRILRKVTKKTGNAMMKRLSDQHKYTITIPDALHEQIMAVYKESNHALAKHLKRDLSAYGYF